MGREQTRTSMPDAQLRNDIRQDFIRRGKKASDYFAITEPAMSEARFYAALRGEPLTQIEDQEFTTSWLTWKDYWSRQDAATPAERAAVLTARIKDLTRQIEDLSGELASLAGEQAGGAQRRRRKT